MKSKGVIITGVVLFCAAAMTGCVKKIKVTIANHSDVTRTVSVTVPDGTQTVGAVSAGGRLTHTLAVKTEDFPAQCNYAVSGGGSQSFTVDEDSPGRWYFHITKEGKVAGPYGKDDVHAETKKEAEVEIRIPAGTVVR